MTRISRISIIGSVALALAGLLTPIQGNSATTSTLTTCMSLTTGTERISHTGKCRITQEAQANWHQLTVDSVLPDTKSNKQIVICSNKPTSPVSYEIIRPKCAKYQIRSEYFRSSLLTAAPVITKVEATGYNSAQISLAKDPNANPDAPVAYYTITSSKGQSKNVYSWGELNLTINNLSELTAYTFTVTSTTADGTSKISSSSELVTTSKYVAPPVSTKTAPVAQVSILSSDTASVTIPEGATSVVVAAPTLGNPSLSFASQRSSVSATISSAANPAAGASTPFTVSGSTKIVDIAVVGLSGSATVCLDASPTAKLWHYIGGAWVDITTSHTSTQVCGLTSSFSPFAGEDQIAAPAFTISSIAETKTVGFSLSGYSITSTGGTIASYSISPAISNNPGLAFSTATGLITGTPTAARTARIYTISAINGSGSASRSFTVTTEAVIYTVGQTGPGGGKIFYVAPTPFSCGPTLSELCTYLEASPRTGPNYWVDTLSIWSGNVTDGISVRSSIGTGYINTLEFIAQAGAGVNGAAFLAHSFNGPNNLSDWYLPSELELLQLWRTVSSIGPMGQAGWYWSSTQNNSNPTSVKTVHSDPSAGYSTDQAKTISPANVRPIRAF